MNKFVKDFPIVWDELKRWRIVELNPDIDFPSLPIQAKKAITLQCPNCSKISNTTMNMKIKHNKDGSYRMRGCSCKKSPKSSISIKDFPKILDELKRWRIVELNPDVDIPNLPIQSTKAITLQCPNCSKISNTTIISKIRRNKDGSYYISMCKCSCKKGPIIEDFPIISDELKRWRIVELNPDIDFPSLPIQSKKAITLQCPNCSKISNTAINVKIRRNKDGSYYISMCKCSCKKGPIIEDFPIILDELKRWRIVELNPDVDIPSLPIQSTKAITLQCPKCSKISNTTINDKIKRNKDGSYCMRGCNCCKKSPKSSISIKDYPEILDELKRWRIVELNPDIDFPSLPIQSGVAITLQCPKCSKISNTTINVKIKHNKDGSYC